MFIRDIDVLLLLSLRNHHPAVEVLLHRELAVILGIRDCVRADSTVDIEVVPRVTLAFPPPIAPISAGEVCLHAICGVVQVVQRAQCPVRVAAATILS